jgi:hypothetical protein
MASSGAVTAEAGGRIDSFRAFWPFYLGQHSRWGTRLLHYIGTSAALLLVAVAPLVHRPKLALIALVVGYAPAWIAHFFIEKNRPATFRYPLWSLLADFKMLAVAIRRGRI